MARRKNTSSAEDALELFHAIFMHVPAWLCLPAAALGFFGLKLLIHKVTAGKMLWEQLGVQYGSCAAGLLAFLILLAGLTAGIKKRQRRRLLEKQRGLDTLRELSWSDFELLVGEAYGRLGYQVTETGGGGADGGIDLKLTNSSGQTLLVQCKQWRVQKIGVKPVRELYGVLHAEEAARAIFVTTGVYTQEARSFAEGKPIELVDGETLARLIAPLRGQVPSRPEDEETLRVSTGKPSTSVEAPPCPVCQSEMVLRTAKKGWKAGSQFWGCSDYPKCRGTRQA